MRLFSGGKGKGHPRSVCGPGPGPGSVGGRDRRELDDVGRAECAVERVVDRSQACPRDGPDACCACARERGRESVCRPAGPTYAAARAEALCAV